MEALLAERLGDAHGASAAPGPGGYGGGGRRRRPPSHSAEPSVHFEDVVQTTEVVLLLSCQGLVAPFAWTRIL